MISCHVNIKRINPEEYSIFYLFVSNCLLQLKPFKMLHENVLTIKHHKRKLKRVSTSTKN